MEKQYNFDEIINRRGTQSVKLECLPQNAAPEALPLWVADMDFPCADPILDALHRRVEQRIFGYSNYDSNGVRQSVQEWFWHRFQWHVEEEQIVFSPGVVPAIAFLLQILTEPGDGIIIQQPVYYPFMIKILQSGRYVVNNALKYINGTYQMDVADLEEKFADPKNKGLLLCSPHNPVGRVWKAEELKAVVSLAKTYGKWIVVDEIHCDLIRKGHQHHPLLKLCSEYQEQIISCTAPSKTFNLAGLQISNIIIPNEMYRKKWHALTFERYAIASANPFSLTAMMAAYREGESWLNQVNTYIDKNIAFAKAFLKEQLPKAHLVEPEGTYLLWIDLRAYSSDAKQLEQWMLKEAGVVLDEGYIFGESGSGFERINAACPRSVLEDGLRRMASVLQRQSASGLAGKEI